MSTIKTAVVLTKKGVAASVRPLKLVKPIAAKTPAVAPSTTLTRVYFAENTRTITVPANHFAVILPINEPTLSEEGKTFHLAKVNSYIGKELTEDGQGMQMPTGEPLYVQVDLRFSNRQYYVEHGDEIREQRRLRKLAAQKAAEMIANGEVS